jgi:hypothetical protein
LKVLIYSILISGFLFMYCDKESTNPENNNISQGTISVTGDYTTTLKYVLPIQNLTTGEYYGVIASQSLSIFSDEFTFGLYSEGYGVFTKIINDTTLIGYCANNLNASYDVSDTLRPSLTVNNIVLYYDSTRVFLGIWEFNGNVLDSTKSVTLNGHITTDLSGFQIDNKSSLVKNNNRMKNMW